MLKMLRKLFRDERGGNAIEYALIAGLIAIAFVVGATALGGALNTFFQNMKNCINSPTSATCNISAIG